MPLFGAHLSIAGGYHKAVESASAFGMDTVQLFTHSPSQWAVRAITPPKNEPPPEGARSPNDHQQWAGKAITDAERDQFTCTVKATGIQHPTAHDSYLINLASPEEGLYRRSIEAFVDEVVRAERLQLSYLVTHPGTPTDGNESAGLDRIVSALDEVHERCPHVNVQVLLETTAGQGKTLGHRFEHLAYLLKHVKASDRLGICVDTCHVFAAGYELAPKRKYLETFRTLDRLVGIDRIKVFHVNDSMKPLGSQVDRHAHLGKGCLGLEPFSYLVNDRRFRDHAMILETPKEGENGEEMDPVNLQVLKDLLTNS